MDFDFNVILVPLTLLLGVIWLLDKLWFKQYKRKGAGVTTSAEVQAAQLNLDKKRQAYESTLLSHDYIGQEEVGDVAILEGIKVDDAPMPIKIAEREYREAKRHLHLAAVTTKPKGSQAHFLIRWAHDYFPVLAIVLIVRSFIVEPFNIPSSSMVPALYTGDFVAVNKYAYGIRLPLIYNKVIDTGSPEHGDVAVFRYPENPKIYYIKRVIGLPGDTLSFDNGQLSVNGKPVPTTPSDFVADPVLTDRLYTAGNEPGLTPEKAVARGREEEEVAQYFQEQLGDHTYLRRYLSGNMSYNSPWSITVPEGNYFVMGDNSDRSEDSRFWGFVPDKNLSGKAVYVWMHKKPGLNLPTFKYNRSID